MWFWHWFNWLITGNSTGIASPPQLSGSVPSANVRSSTAALNAAHCSSAAAAPQQLPTTEPRCCSGKTETEWRIRRPIWYYLWIITENKHIGYYFRVLRCFVIIFTWGNIIVCHMEVNFKKWICFICYFIASFFPLLFIYMAEMLYWYHDFVYKILGTTVNT